MPSPYATVQQLYDFLKAEAIVCSARRVEAVDTSSNRLLIPGHGMITNDVLRVELGADGYGGTPSMPSPLSAFTPYYVIKASSDLIALSLTAGGSAVDLTTAGAGLLSVVMDMEASLTRHIALAAGRIDACLTHNGVEMPLVGDWPALTSLVLRLVAWPVLLARGYTAGRQVDPDQDFKVLWQDAEEELDDLCAGKPCAASGGLPMVAGSTAFSTWDTNRMGWTAGETDGAI